MSDQANRVIVERKWQACSHPVDLAELQRVFDDHAVVEYPQSGERIVGKRNIIEVHKARPDGAPTYALRRILGSGDLWFTEQLGDYGGELVHGSSVFELEGGRIVRETDYFAEPFEAPEWRRLFVERA